MKNTPTEFTHKTITSFPSHRNFEEEGKKIHNSLDELVYLLSKLSEKYNYNTISSIYFRINSKEKIELCSAFQKFFITCVHFLEKRKNKTQKCDEEKRVKIVNALLHDLARTAQKNNLPHEFMYELARSLKYMSYYEEISILLNALFQEPAPHMVDTMDNTLEEREVVAQKFIQRAFRDPYALLDMEISEFPLFSQFNALIFYVTRNSVITKLIKDDEDLLIQVLEKELDKTSSSDDVYSQKFASFATEYLYHDKINMSQHATNHIPEKTLRSSYSPTVIKRYNRSVEEDKSNNLLAMLVSDSTQTAYNTDVQNLTFLSVMNASLWRIISYASDEEREMDEKFRASTDGPILEKLVQNPKKFLANIDLIIHPTGEIALASAPLFPLRYTFHYLGLGNIYEILQGQVRQAHNTLQKFAEEEITHIAEEVYSPIKTLKEKLQTLLGESQKERTYSAKEYINALEKLGFEIKIGNGSHKKATHPCMNDRPITIANNDSLHLSVLKKNFAERGIPPEYLIGVLKNVFSAQEKKILEKLPSLSDIDQEDR